MSAKNVIAMRVEGTLSSCMTPSLFRRVGVSFTSTHHRHSRIADLVHSPALDVGVEEECHAEPHAAYEEAQGHRIGVEYTRQRHCVRFPQRQDGVASVALASLL